MKSSLETAASSGSRVSVWCHSRWPSDHGDDGARPVVRAGRAAARRCALASARSAGLSNHSPSQSSIWSAPITRWPGWRDATRWPSARPALRKPRRPEAGGAEAVLDLLLVDRGRLRPRRDAGRSSMPSARRRPRRGRRDGRSASWRGLPDSVTAARAAGGRPDGGPAAHDLGGGFLDRAAGDVDHRPAVAGKSRRASATSWRTASGST